MYVIQCLKVPFNVYLLFVVLPAEELIFIIVGKGRIEVAVDKTHSHFSLSASVLSRSEEEGKLGRFIDPLKELSTSAITNVLLLIFGLMKP